MNPQKPPITTQKSTAHLQHLYTTQGLTPPVITLFRHIIYIYYSTHQRLFPWRNTRNPYHILISEIMLQQTLTQRVLPKYTAFITQFPDFATLAHASNHDILALWHGLGYNRRALSLKKIAETVIADHNGALPTTEHTLRTLPGIGPYTAAAICAFAYNQPTILMDTNIQSVYIHFFFDTHTKIKDTAIRPFIEKTLDTDHPRDWYYALMDYGVMLKKTYPNPSRKSAHYIKQPVFTGSTRQQRGQILTTLLEHTILTENQIQQYTEIPPPVVTSLLTQLQKEGFIKKTDKGIHIA